MTPFLKLFQWVLKAAVFFTLFAFALNNQHEASVHFFFGTQWHSPMVLVVLAAFTLGVAVGALGMVPRWWRHRQLARKAEKAQASANSMSQAVMPPHSPTSPLASPTAHLSSSTPSAIASKSTSSTSQKTASSNFSASFLSTPPSPSYPLKPSKAPTAQLPEDLHGA